MNQIEVWLQAQALIGLIERRNAHDPRRSQEVILAYNRAVMDLKRGEDFIWLLKAGPPHNDHVYVLYEPPLRVYFRRIHENKIGIVSFEEIEIDWRN